MAHPPPGCPIPTDVGEASLVVAVRGTERHLLDRLVDQQALQFRRKKMQTFLKKNESIQEVSSKSDNGKMFKNKGIIGDEHKCNTSTKFLNLTCH